MANPGPLARSVAVTLLLDTCTFLWLVTDDRRLPLRTRTDCRDPTNAVYLSALSVWEIAIKYRRGRLSLPESPESFVANRRQRLQIEPLPFDERDAAHDVVLPQHHRDPFDRGIVSQAILRGMTIVTPDPMIARYPAPVLWL